MPYQLEHKRTADSTWTVDGSGYSAASFPVTISGLTQGTPYDVRCKAIDAVGNSSAYSATSQATTQTAGSQVVVGGYQIPSLQNERDLYTSMGLSWSAGIEPTFASEGGAFTPETDLNGNTEGDDLGSYLYQYLRTNQAGYLNRAQIVRNWWVSSGVAAAQTDASTAGGAHMYGTGLIAWAQWKRNIGTPDTAVETVIDQIAQIHAHLWGPDTEYSATPNGGMFSFALLRVYGRQIAFINQYINFRGNVSINNRLPSAGTIQAATLLNTMVDLVLNETTYWNGTYGMWFGGEYETDVHATAPWQRNYPFVVGQYVKNSLNNQRFKVTTAGTTGATEPSWSTTVGNFTTSGTAVFRTQTVPSATPYAGVGYYTDGVRIAS